MPLPNHVHLKSVLSARLCTNRKSCYRRPRSKLPYIATAPGSLVVVGQSKVWEGVVVEEDVDTLPTDARELAGTYPPAADTSIRVRLGLLVADAHCPKEYWCPGEQVFVASAMHCRPCHAVCLEPCNDGSAMAGRQRWF